MTNLDKTLTIRISADELVSLRAAAAHDRRRLSEWVRLCLLDIARHVPADERVAAVSEIAAGRAETHSHAERVQDSGGVVRNDVSGPSAPPERAARVVRPDPKPAKR